MTDPPGPERSKPSTPAPLGVVIPTLDEEEALPFLLDDLAALPLDARVVVVDGGSWDATREVARARGAHVIETPPGRARQMAAGARALDTPWLLFLHADSRLPPPTREALARWLEDPGPGRAGHFRFRLASRGLWWRLIEGGQGVRERLTALVYGDQGLLVARDRLEEVGGVPDLPLMEDVELARRLRRTGGLHRIPADLITSVRRYREEGPLLGWLRNASLITLYSLGISPHRLARWYPPRRPSTPGAGRGSEAARTLLVFAKAPEPGRVKTRLARELGEEGAARLYRHMGRMVVDRIRKGPYRVRVHYDPPGAEATIAEWLGRDDGLEFLPQEGQDLGARMERAFRHAFARGGPVVIIGTDAPGVDRELVIAAFRLLERSGGPHLVLGPATDGGYYLMGLRSPQPGLFRDVPWSTSRVLKLTLERAREAGLGWELLEPLTDVDRPDDLSPELQKLARTGSGEGMTRR